MRMFGVLALDRLRTTKMGPAEGRIYKRVEKRREERREQRDSDSVVCAALGDLSSSVDDY